MRVLAQISPADGVLTDAFTAPSGQPTELLAIQVSNRHSADILISVTYAPLGVADAVTHSFLNAIKVKVNEAGNGAALSNAPFGLPLSLKPTDKIRVKTDHPATFTLLGF